MTNFIVVTGASKGIGQALVDALVDDGSLVIGAHVCRPGAIAGKPTARFGPHQQRAL
jgi:NAD(P)-dependent dehydrogenase (short-subunit alcohol dehydrogenase family)